MVYYWWYCYICLYRRRIHKVQGIYFFFNVTLINFCCSPSNAEVGDILVLTKPLGAQLACNTNRWSEDPQRWEKLSKVITLEDVQVAFNHAVNSMARLNKNGNKINHLEIYAIKCLNFKLPFLCTNIMHIALRT